MAQLCENPAFEHDRRHLLHPFAEFPRVLEDGSRVFSRAEGVSDLRAGR